MIVTMWVSAGVAVLGGLLAWAVRRFGRRRWPRASATVALLIAAAVAPIAAFSLKLAVFWLAGQPTPAERRIADGVVYRRYVLTVSHRAVVHVIEISRPMERRFVVTPPVQKPAGLRNEAGYGPAALDALGADLLINANFFRPFHDAYVFDAYPGPGDVIEPVGTVVSQGTRYGLTKPEWPSFWQAIDDGQIGMGPPPVDAMAAVTGRQFIGEGRRDRGSA